MVLNDPRVREAMQGLAGSANEKLKQQYQAWVEREIAKATAPLKERITELEARVARLEAGGSAARSAPPAANARQRAAMDRDSI